MKEEILLVKTALEACFTLQTAATGSWHDSEPEDVAEDECASLEALRNLVLREHLMNFKLWHVEDMARRTDVPDSDIAACKRKVDSLNQRRNNAMEAVDSCLNAQIFPYLPSERTTRRNTETVGMAVDRLSILALKVYHMEEQAKRRDADETHRAACLEKLEVLRHQRADLVQAVLELVDDYAAGVKVPAMYRQFKMYNDPTLNPELYSAGKK